MRALVSSTVDSRSRKYWSAFACHIIVSRKPGFPILCKAHLSLPSEWEGEEAVFTVPSSSSQHKQFQR